MNNDLKILRTELRKKANPEKAKVLKGFYKTGPGQYAENDVFIGVVMPELRKLVKQFLHLSIKDIESLIHSPIHEERMLGLLLLVAKYKKGSDQEKHLIYRCYTKNLAYVNNWDLVDFTADHIIGEHLYQRSKIPLQQWAKSKNLWKRRVAILATFNYIKKSEFTDALQIADLLINDKEDLIHKAVGWMLREIGKRDIMVEENFLKSRYRKMPRTMLRYAIEHFPENKRKAYLHEKI